MTIVEMVRSVPRNERHAFLLVELNQMTLVRMHGAAASPTVLASDVRALEAEGLLRRASGGSRVTTPYDVTPAGFEYYDRLKREAGGPAEAMEDSVTRYLDAPNFATRHGPSYAKWRQATDELWSTDSERELTSVGHHIREAMQLFATELVEMHNAIEAPADPEKTVDRLRAVLALAAPKLGQTEKPVLDAMVVYWGSVTDLAHRQEHGVAKEVPLVWEDARRLVFQTAIVMFELDRTFTRAFGG